MKPASVAHDSRLKFKGMKTKKNKIYYEKLFLKFCFPNESQL